MSEPNSSSEPTPPVPPAPTFTYGSPAAPATPPAAGAPLPPPAYGERIPGYENAPVAAPPAYAAPAYGAPVAPGGRRRRMWDVVLTVILLVVGFFGMLIGLFYAAIFSDPTLLDEAMAEGGLGGFNGEIGAGPTIIAVSHVVLYLVAAGVGILLLVTRRIAFWVPLTAGVLAAIVFWGTLMGILLSDPQLISNYYR